MLRPHRHNTAATPVVYPNQYVHQPAYYQAPDNAQHSTGGYYPQPVLLPNMFQGPPPPPPQQQQQPQQSSREVNKNRHDMSAASSVYPSTAAPLRPPLPAGYHTTAAPPRITSQMPVVSVSSRASVTAPVQYSQQAQQQQQAVSAASTVAALSQPNLHLPPPTGPPTGQPAPPQHPPHTYNTVPPAVAAQNPQYVVVMTPPGAPHPGPAAAIPPSPYTAVPTSFPAHYNPAQFAGQSGMFPGSAAATAAGALWQPGPQPRLAVMHQYQQQRLHATKVSRRVAIVNPDTGVELDIAAATNTASSQAGGDVSLAAGDDASTSPSGQTARRQVEVNTAEGVEVRQQFAERVSRLAADSSVTLRRQSESVSAKTVTATEEVISSPPPAVTPQQNGVLTEHECEEEEQNGEVAATPSHVSVSDEPNDDDAGDVEDKEVTVTTTVETAPVTSTSSVCDNDRDKNSVADTADQPDSSSATEQVRGASTSQQQQSGSRRSGRQKMRELGRRAEERQSGGDMDAFIDDRSCSDAAVTTTPPPPPSESVSTATVKSSDDSPSDEPVPAATTTVEESADEAACSTVTAAAAVVPVESQADEAEALEDGEIRDDVDDTTEAAVNGVTTTSQTPPPSSEPTPAPEPPAVMSERDLLIAAIRAIGGSKRSYSREEMETLQRHPLSHQRPLRLPDLPNVVRHSPLDPHRLVALRARGSAPMTGLVDLGSRSQGKLYRGGRGSQQGRRDLGMIQPQLLTQPMQQPIRRVEISLNRDVKLQSAENAWKAGHKANKQQLDETTTLLKSLTCLLNKITPSNVYKLIDEIKELKINTLAQLIRVIDVLFIKAVDEPSYAELYAKVCNGIFKTEVECSEEKSGKVTLRKVLLTKCQREFEKDKTLELNKDKRLAEIKAIKDEKERSLKKFELQEEARKIRLRSNGNLRFIGELYKLDLLTDRIMQLCIAKLIMEGHEDSYECLCKLLTTIGAKLEKSEMEHRILDQPFQEIQRLCTTTKVSSRVRFMMEDLVELRANKWVSKRVGDTAKPMTIEQVHEEARIEDANMRQRLALMEDRRHVATSRSSTGADRFRAGASSPGGAALRVGAGSMSASVGGWSTTPSRNFDSSRLMAVTNRSSSGGMPKMAKPGGDWSHGSMASAGGGGLSMTMRSARGLPDLRSSSGVAMSANRFDALRSDTGADTTASPVTVAGKHGVTAGRPAGVRLSSSLSAANGSSKTAVSASSAASSAVPASSTAGQTRGSSGSSQQQQRASGAVFTGRADVTAEKMAVKIPNMINELVQHGDFEESMGDCLRELHDKTVLMFIEQSVHSLIDLSDAKVRHMAGALHQQLLERNIITSQQYLAGLSETVPVLVDLVCDVPAMWTNLAELVAPVLLPVSCCSSTVADPSGRCVISLSSLATAVKPAVEAGCGQALTRALFRRVLSLRGVAALRAIVPASFQWSSLLTRGEPAQLLAEWDMKYLVAGERAPLSPQCAAHLPQRLRHLISAVSEQTVGCGDDAALSSWLSEQGLMPDSDDQQTQEYQCALATDLLSALCFNCVLTNSGSDNSYVVDSERLERHAGLMKRAISPASCVTTAAGGGGEPGREVAALNSLTGLVNQLRHPPNLLDGLFRGLYDCDVIGEGSFVAWRDDTHVQVEGKGSAVASVHRFFNELLQQQDEGGATAPSLPH